MLHDDIRDAVANLLEVGNDFDIDVDASWDEKKEVYRISDKIVRTTNVTQSAIVKKGYSTVLAASVFLF